MLTDASGQTYFSFVEPHALPESTQAELSQFCGIGNSAAELESKADPISLHKNASGSPFALPERLIIVPPFNSLIVTTDKPTVNANSFALGLRVCPAHLCFCRIDGETRELRAGVGNVRVYGFDGKRFRRFRDFSTIGIGISELIRRGFRFASELS